MTRRQPHEIVKAFHDQGYCPDDNIDDAIFYLQQFNSQQLASKVNARKSPTLIAFAVLGWSLAVIGTTFGVLEMNSLRDQERLRVESERQLTVRITALSSELTSAKKEIERSDAMNKVLGASKSDLVEIQKALHEVKSAMSEAAKPNAELSKSAP